jgi:hypothetical protein
MTWGEERRRLREDYASELAMQKDGTVRQSQLALDNVIAAHTLEQDLDEDGFKRTYQLSDTIRDRLIAHARQDASLAVIVSESCRKEIRTLRKLVFLLIILQGISIWVAIS